MYSHTMRAVTEIIPRVVLADHARGRRKRLAQALTARGYAIIATASGRRALRFVEAYASPLLVAHVELRCEGEPFSRFIRRDYGSLQKIRILWFGSASSPRPALASTGSFVCCARGLEPVTDTIDDLLQTKPAARQRPDVLLSLMKLDAALGELGGWSL